MSGTEKQLYKHRFLIDQGHYRNLIDIANREAIFNVDLNLRAKAEKHQDWFVKGGIGSNEPPFTLEDLNLSMMVTLGIIKDRLRPKYTKKQLVMRTDRVAYLHVDMDDRLTGRPGL